MLTTHYIRLCKLLNKMKNIENCNMETQIIKNVPNYTYKMIKGISKIKGGIIVLRQLNYPDKIIQESKKIIRTL